MASEDSASTKKPQGVDGAKIYLKIDGTASTNRKEYQFLAFDKKQPIFTRTNRRTRENRRIIWQSGQPTTTRKARSRKFSV